MPGPPRWVRETRPRLFDGKPCAYCANPMKVGSKKRKPTRDHGMPRSRGGGAFHAGRFNIFICCEDCNGDKKDYDLGEWWLRLFRGGDRRADIVLALLIKLTLADAAPIEPKHTLRITYEWSKDGLARYPVGGEWTPRHHDLDDAGRARDPAQ
jgi:hypothetical protein